MAKKRNLKRTAKKSTPVVSESDSDSKHPESLPDSINSKIIAEALSSVNQNVLLKLCRLCENKDGPFLNIFDADKVTAKKIDEVMPFVIAENDDLPHKICFRCSAKVEELYEFIQKCIKTQENLRKSLGKKGPVTIKAKSRTRWEDKLNQCNISNDDICNALIKKAMEGIKDIPMMPIESNENIQRKDSKYISKSNKKKDTEVSKVKEQISSSSDDEEAAPSIKQIKLELPKIDPEVSKSTRQAVSNVRKNNKEDLIEKNFTVPKPENEVTKTKTFSIDLDSSELDTVPKPFNIMDHVSMIKVNSVGILFQCKLCNRNFLKKEVVLNHGCAKNGGKKIAEEVKTIAPEPPKIPLIKYINTKIQNDFKKQPEMIQNDGKNQIMNSTPINIDDDDDDKPLQKPRTKPRIGPASKVKRTENISPLPETPSKQEINAQAAKPLAVTPSTSATVAPTVQLPFTTPNLKSRFKLVPGPNNTFMLVEENSESQTIVTLPNNSASINLDPVVVQNISKESSVHKSTAVETRPNVSEQPYPVGLIKTGVSQQSSPFPPQQQAITTPAMKKQSYTIVQTGNPSKFLISTKPQPPEEVPKKKLRKIATQPYTVTIEDTSQPKNSFFTFVNVDPLLQPSYVLPTENIIQESQISTSTAKAAEAKEREKYTCNMCDEKFSREKKLLAHIQSHYNKLDEEDKLRAQANSKKRKSKS